MGRPYRIMTFDGGGVRGIYSATLLDRLLAARPQLLAETDLFAGTSAGGLIALCLASGRLPGEIRGFFRDWSKKIFYRSFWRFLGDMLKLTKSKYDNDGLIDACECIFGEARLGDLPRRVIVPAFDLKSDGASDPSWRPRFFHNLDNTGLDESVADLAIRTASAPTYFPTYQGYIDGGVAVNSPSMLAVAQALELAPGVGLEDIRLISVGTGGQIEYLDGQSLDWGGLKWLDPVLQIFMASQSLVADAMCEKALGSRYRRLSPVIPNIELDAVKRFTELENLAANVDLWPAIDFLDSVYLA